MFRVVFWVVLPCKIIVDRHPSDAVERKTNLLLRKSSLPEEVIKKAAATGFEATEAIWAP
jgi:hypothetical protein